MQNAPQFIENNINSGQAGNNLAESEKFTDSPLRMAFTIWNALSVIANIVIDDVSGIELTSNIQKIMGRFQTTIADMEPMPFADLRPKLS